MTEIGQKQLLARFMNAWERADFDALALILREDAILAMPSEPMWLRGRAAIIRFFSTVPAAGRLQHIRLVPIYSNRQPAVGAFIAQPDERGHQFYGVLVLEMAADVISSITGFAEPELSESFRLPAWLRFGQQDRG